MRDTDGSPQWQDGHKRKRLLQQCVKVIWREQEQRIKLDTGPRSFAAVKSTWFLNLEQVQAGWISSKKWCMEVEVQNPLLGANSNIVQSGAKGP